MSSSGDQHIPIEGNDQTSETSLSRPQSRQSMERQTRGSQVSEAALSQPVRDVRNAAMQIMSNIRATEATPQITTEEIRAELVSPGGASETLRGERPNFPRTPGQEVSTNHILLTRYFMEKLDNSMKETYYDMKHRRAVIEAWLDKHKNNFSDIHRRERDYYAIKSHLNLAEKDIENNISSKIDISSKVRAYKDKFLETLAITEDLHAFYNGTYVETEMPDFSAQRVALTRPTIDSHRPGIQQMVAEGSRRQQELTQQAQAQAQAQAQQTQEFYAEVHELMIGLEDSNVLPELR